MTLLDKIQSLKDKFFGSRADPQDISVIASWESEAKRLFLLQSLKGHDGVKYVFEVFKGEVNKINETLNKSYSKDLKDTERDRLLDKRDLAQKYINLFETVEEDLSKLEDVVDRETV